MSRSTITSENDFSEPETRRALRTAQRQQTPTWPALIVITLAAIVLYSWNLGGVSLHPYYTAAVRSMSTDWHAFAYGSLDSGGFISVDKIPGALWLQALSVRLFGLHVWAVALPQALMGVFTILALYRIVRDWISPAAGVLAAAAMLVTPIAATLDRRNISDTMLTFLLVLAAGAALRATRSGRLLPLLVCAVLVGLAFHGKMLQAWVVLPVFGAVFAYAAPISLRRRVIHVVAAGVTTLAVSCVWVVLVWLTPSADRPYVDGTTNNNPFSLVFGYNGISRFAGDGTALSAVPGTAASRPDSGSGWIFLFTSSVAPQITWFLPAALIGLGLGLRAARGAARTDTTRAGYLIWGGWLLINYLVFAVSTGNHAYYTIILAPAIAALAGAGAWSCWELYRKAGKQDQDLLYLPILVLATLAWAALLDGIHDNFLPWLIVVVAVLGFGALLALFDQRRWGVWLALAAVLISPACWTYSVLSPTYAGSGTSPLAGPVGPAYREAKRGDVTRPVSFTAPAGRYTLLLTYLTQHRGGAYYLAATQAAAPAEPLLRATSAPVLVMGGFTGNTPFPSAQGLAREVQTHRVRYAILASNRPKTQASRWVTEHCTRVPQQAYGDQGKTSLSLYDCATR